MNERGFIQTTPLPGRAQSNRFALPEATVVLNGITTSQVADGDSATVRIANTNVTFEFNAGPQLSLNLDPINAPARVLQDGDTFSIDGTQYRIYTTPVAPAVPAGVRTVFYSRQCRIHSLLIH